MADQWVTVKFGMTPFPGAARVESADTVRFTVTGVDLAVAGVSEADEETQGVFVPLNDDADEGAVDAATGLPVKDKTAAGIAAGDNEVVSATVTIASPAAPGNWTVTPPANLKVYREMAGVWTDIGGVAQSVAAGATSVPLRLEGVAASAAVRDGTLTASFTPSGGVALTDTVKTTVFDVDLQIQGLVEEDASASNELDPGAFVGLNDDDDDAGSGNSGDGIVDKIQDYPHWRLDDPGTPGVDEAGPYDDDLVPVSLVVTPHGLSGLDLGTLSLTADSGGEKVRLWRTRPDGIGTPAFDDDVTWNLADADEREEDGTYQASVEGIESSADARDIILAVQLQVSTAPPATNRAVATVPTGSLVAHRPQQPGGGYAPFAKSPVAQADENFMDVGPGIRINYDDDDEDGVPDATAANGTVGEDDLVEVDLAAGGGTYDLVRGSNKLRVWTTATRTPGTEIVFDANGRYRVTNGPLTTLKLWVEWQVSAHGTETLRLTAVAGVWMGMPQDALTFHTFHTQVVVFGDAAGAAYDNPTGTLPEGIYQIGGMLYRSGYDVFMYGRDAVDPNTGVGVPVNRVYWVSNHHIQANVVVIGNGRGGASVYDAARLFWPVPPGVRPFNVNYTAYIDAVDNGDPLPPYAAETALPATAAAAPATTYHINLYQRNAWDTKGDAVVGADLNSDVNITAWGANLTHANIDNDPNVQMIILDGMTVAGVPFGPGGIFNLVAP